MNKDELLAAFFFLNPRTKQQPDNVVQADASCLTLGSLLAASGQAWSLDAIDISLLKPIKNERNRQADSVAYVENRNEHFQKTTLE